MLVHNHPSGDPKPSRDDIEMTREIKAAAEAKKRQFSNLGGRVGQIGRQ